VGHVRHVGRWFLEICFRSFAQDLAAPSARSFAHESESQNAMQPARSYAQDLASREGQRPRCPCNDESDSGDAAPPRGPLCFAQESESQNTMQPARSFAHRIPHEMIKASSLCEALRHFLLENQMSHSSHASHTSHPQAESKARSTSHPPTNHNKTTTKHNKKGKLK